MAVAIVRPTGAITGTDIAQELQLIQATGTRDCRLQNKPH